MMDGYIMWSPGVTLDTLEKQAILKAFEFYKKNKIATCNSLGIALRTLDNKLDRYEHEEKIEQERKANEAARNAEFLVRQRGNPPRNDGLPYTPYSPDRQHDTFPGIRMESVANSSQKPAMSMPERKEVQTVLPKNPSQSGRNKAR